eukprot:TRINITY_DN5518_c0_g1_i1.p1 TRINITY_DN5518_c0_g1~~TRINITY_DN5518_c0_g1_i1.p1  ORF type:complete len:476 (+),score=139.15 TRINITY_DN5518_c0_g1_i1:49-1428(+)
MASRLFSSLPRLSTKGLRYSSTVNGPPTRITTLKNGFRVASEDGFGETASVGVWIDAGSVFENDKTNGTAHFLEHMAFKGTPNRSRTQLESEVENLGAHLNAYTSREQTVYVTQSFKDDVPQMVDLLGDILQNSNLSEADIEAERAIILREKESVEENLEEVVFDHLHSAAYQGTSHALTILGETENIQSIQRSDLVNYIDTNYTGPRMTLVGTGAVKHEDLVAYAEKTFGGLSSEDTKVKSNVRVPFTGSEIRIRTDEMKEAHLAIAFESVGWSSPHYFSYLVLQALVGSWDRNMGAGTDSGSRLAETVAKEGLAHKFHAFNTVYNNTGLFGVYAVAAPGEKFGDLTYEILNEFQKLNDYISVDELERAKSKVKMSLLHHLDGNMQKAEDIGRQVLTLGRRMTNEELFLRIDSITKEDLSIVLDTYFYDVCPTVIGMGPIADLPDYNLMRSWTYWNRW